VSRIHVYCDRLIAWIPTKKMPRVLRIINRLNLGGPTYNAALLTRFMSPEFETLLVAGKKLDAEESSEFIIEELGLSATIIQEMQRELNPLNDYASFQKIKKIIREFKPDIVHTHAAKAGALGRLAARQMRVPVVVHTFHGNVFHSYFSPFKTKFILRAERYLAKKSSAIVAISEQQKEDLINYKICPSENIAVIPLGFDLTKFREEQDEKRKNFRSHYSINKDEVAIGIIGRLVPIKNHALFLEALKNVMTRTTKKVRAFIIGDGEERDKLETLAGSLHLPFNKSNDASVSVLTFTSWIKNIDWAMAGLDIVAMTSFNEGTPVSLVEAQAAGKPIVSTNVGGIKNIVSVNETAFLSESGDVEQLSENLLRLVEEESLRIKMSALGWENVRDKFHYGRLVADMKNLYNNLLGNC
jgi:glycosyltransferase involved in cell wall biosynthesis